MTDGTRLLAIALALAALGGCASRNHCNTSLADSTRVFDCRPTNRESLRPDVSAVLGTDTAPPIAAKAKFCALAEHSVQCLAAASSTTANLLVQEADAQTIGRPAHSYSSELTSQILRLEAIHRRNAAAAAALETFLRLAEAEGGADNLERREQVIQSMLVNIGHLHERGMLSPVSKSDVESQRIELEHRRAELRSTIQRLNSQLKDLLGVAIADDTRFWPEARLTVTIAKPEPGHAVAVALANRADLAAARLAAKTSGPEGVLAARAVIQLTSGLALPPPTSGLARLTQVHSARLEEPFRSRQMAELLTDRDRAAKNETRQAVSVVETRLVQIGLTNRRLELAKERLKSSEQQQRISADVPLNVQHARLDVLAVEQDLLHDVIEWKLAVAKLKEAQGLLAVECGYADAARFAAPCAR